APGDFHMEVARKGHRLNVKLHQGAEAHGVRPSGDILLKSVAQHAGPSAIGVILTGMGRDGASGLLAMREEGCYTIAQDEQSSVIYGMPKEAVRCEAAMAVVPLERIAKVLLSRIFKNRAA